MSKPTWIFTSEPSRKWSSESVERARFILVDTLRMKEMKEMKEM